MARKRTGSASEVGDRRYIRVSTPSGRVTRRSRAASDLDDARERARIADELVVALVAAGREAFIEPTIKLMANEPASDIDGIRKGVRDACRGRFDGKAAPAPLGTTFETFAKQLTDGDLRKRFPNYVGPLGDATAKDYKAILRDYINPVIGPTPLRAITLDHALEVMRKVPAKLSNSRKRCIAQTIHRVLTLAAFPARVIPMSPLPRGFLPRLGPRRAKGFMFPDEEARVMSLAADVAPLVERVLFGVLAREGMRASEAAGLEWGDARKRDAAGWIDLERGRLYLDAHKTAEKTGARDWSLDAGVLEALTRWRAMNPKARFVFPGDDGARLNIEHLADHLRAFVAAAGVSRAELHESTKTRRRIVAHDLRGVFCTLAFAQGKSEGWITRRTGHTTSDMLARYRRHAENLAEGDVAALRPLHLAIPELRRDGEEAPIEGGEPPSGSSEPSGGESATGSGDEGTGDDQAANPAGDDASSTPEAFRFWRPQGCRGSSPLLRTARENESETASRGCLDGETTKPIQAAAEANSPVLVALDVVTAQIRAAVALGDGASVRRLRGALDALIAPVVDAPAPALHLGARGRRP